MGTKKKWLISLSVLFLMAGCGNKEKEKAEEKEIEKVVEVVAEEVEEEIKPLPFVTPFTGQGVAEEVNQRPIIATINNHPAARPQSGLAAADIVYEMLAEGDVTRFLALYQSSLPEQIGPIRSARSYFIDVAKGLDAFYIAHGYSPEAKTLLAQGVVSNINGMHYDGTYFQRSANRVAPHNSYISGENVLRGAEKVGASMDYSKKVFYTFYRNEESVKLGVRANEVAIRYGQSNSFNSSYVYDEELAHYKRFSASTVTTDYLTGEEIQLSNILFLEMPHRIIDSAGRRSIDISSGGKAYIFQKGMMREIKWKNNDGFLMPIEEDGSEVKLVQGKTWVHFVPTTPGLASVITYSQ